MAKNNDRYTEIELKLGGAYAAFAQLRADLDDQLFTPLLETRAWRVQTYYDTPDLTLFAHDLELRVRPAADGYRQTLKRLISLTEDGLFERDEIQLDQPEALPTLKGIKKYLPKGLGGATRPLHPLMRTEFQRLRFEITQDGARIECAIDEGQVVFIGPESELTRPLLMLELEVKQEGGSDAVMGLSRTLQARYGLAPMFLSKPEQAVQLGHDAGALSDKKTMKSVAQKLQERLG